MTPHWRSIPFFQGSGLLQMAIDSWLFEQCHKGLQPPTLRFYTWSPAAISLGHHQRQWPNHWQELQWHDRPVDIVRRPTGGRAVLHCGDLTYSIILTQQSGHRRETYEYICGFLIQGLKSLGVELQFGRVGRGYQRQVNCFESATAADLIEPNGEKLIGSAQVWHGSTVLQHGSIQLNPDLDLLQQVFGEGADSWRKGIVPSNIHPVSLDATVNALAQASEDYFEQTFVEQLLTPEELNAIQHHLKFAEV
jgi:lipoate---protein ligase